MAANIDQTHSGKPSNSYHKKVKSYLIPTIYRFVMLPAARHQVKAGRS